MVEGGIAKVTCVCLREGVCVSKLACVRCVSSHVCVRVCACVCVCIRPCDSVQEKGYKISFTV